MTLEYYSKNSDLIFKVLEKYYINRRNCCNDSYKYIVDVDIYFFPQMHYQIYLLLIYMREFSLLANFAGCYNLYCLVDIYNQHMITSKKLGYSELKNYLITNYRISNGTNMISGHYQADNMIIYVLSKNLVILLQILSPKIKQK